MTDNFITITLDVGVASTQNFNVVANMEGPNRSYLRYIEEQSKCKLSLVSTPSLTLNQIEDAPAKLTIIGDTQEHVDKAKELAENLIKTVSEQKQKQIQQKAAKKAKKRKSQNKALDLPQQLMIAMKYYYPGPDAPLPPPGSTADLKLHKRKFRQVSSQQHWFDAK
ncbi:KH domain containing protein [Trichomonas vaginalis G3]|uniref:KH domain containing protein n=1 Tax=Trichomonas vaginalis (strain ATCC PRA-98 / G3) TaxID=412133 RepID=A2DFG2_TRIV3|nr:RNA-binding protein, BLOM7 family [Trichomonas vaginalis G3]EAY20890.1 KH domain containing protein [Trichomonas vaginalis G3]KAI5521500.1 RNA-binding protein, BLOM7 family [Trichomonas vaginalis G3]|eukprot:XP_001581876.1 KH domain containing protein [Trichomonas vaginalis G3]